MGRITISPIIDLKASMLEPPATWLDNLLAKLTLTLEPEAEVAEEQPRLGHIPFADLIGALDRAKLKLPRPAQIALYKNWIEANINSSSLLHAAWFNLGVLFNEAGDRSNAAVAYRNSLALRPDMHAASINLGLLFEANDQPEQALATWDNALQPDAVRNTLNIQRGRLLEKLNRLEEAEGVFRQILQSDPSDMDVRHHWIHVRQKICHWPVAAINLLGVSPLEFAQSSGPLGILALTDDIDLHMHTASAWLRRKFQPASQQLAPARPYSHERIRIGYMSSDFCSHAMSYLISELFERHDRTQFEVFGYCSSPDDGTEIRKRVMASFDHVRFIRALSDEQAAHLVRNDEIDILIELNGITSGSRLSVLRWRAAPIQATYLGFVGPVPLPELDYLLCDSFVIPPEHQVRYQPKPLPIGRFFQANDTKRTLGRKLSRTEAGLPDNTFVFCCFSRHYKITEEMFAAWMSILRQTDNTILWLADDNPYSRRNLHASAAKAGIVETRLIFSERSDPDLYLSRLCLADLFLDTFPYNAGTVASDATRMQLPLLTLCGESFASRMAGSLLHTLGAYDGITTSLTKYVSKAVEFASDPAAYNQYKSLFTQKRWDETIGDIEQFTRSYEETWRQIVQIHTFKR